LLACSVHNLLHVTQGLFRGTGVLGSAKNPHLHLVLQVVNSVKQHYCCQKPLINCICLQFLSLNNCCFTLCGHLFYVQKRSDTVCVENYEHLLILLCLKSDDKQNMYLNHHYHLFKSSQIVLLFLFRQLLFSWFYLIYYYYVWCICM